MYAPARLLSLRTALIALALLLVMSVAYAFAAANVVPETGAGDGSGVISGYTVTNVDYIVTSAADTNPSTIETVTFSLADTVEAPINFAVGTPRDVQISLVAGATSFYACTVSGASSPWSVSCPVGGATVLAANQLRVIAVE